MFFYPRPSQSKSLNARKVRIKSLRNTVASFALTIGMGIALTGCGGSSNSGGTVTPTPPPAATGNTFSLNGAAQKGLILSGAVQVLDAANLATVLSSGTSDATTGAFDVNIPASANFSGPFVKVVVTGGNGATMICDAADGCGNTAAGVAIEFGDAFDVDNTVSMSAIIPAPADNGTETIYLSPVTTLAAALAEDAGVSAESLANASSQVADLFGLISADLTAIPPLNITEAAAVADDADALRLALISGGVLSAVLEGSLGLGAGLDAFATEFVANAGQIIENEEVDDPDVISLEDILGGAAAASNANQATGTIVDAVDADVNGDLLTVQVKPAGQLSNSAPSPTINDSALDKGKAFISDFQLIQAAIEADESAADLEEFADRVEAAGRLLEGSGEDLLQATLKGLDALDRAYGAFKDDDTLTSFTYEGIDVAIASNAGATTVSITDALIDGATITISVVLEDENITIANTRDFGSGFSIFNDSITGDVTGSVTGVAENDALRLTLNDFNFVVEDINLSEINEGLFTQSGDSQSTNSLERSIGIGKANIAAKIEQKVSEGLAFEGVAQVEILDGFFRQSNESFNLISNSGQNYVSLDDNKVGVTSGSVGLSGRLSEGGESVSVTLSVDTNMQGTLLSNPEAEPVDWFPHEVNNNIVTETRNDIVHPINADFNIWELLDPATASAEITAFANRDTFIGNGFLLEEGETFDINDYVYANIFNADFDVLKLTYQFPSTQDRPQRNRVIYGQAGFYGLPSDEFIANPTATTTVEFLNASYENALPYLSCTSADELALIRWPTFDEAGGARQAIIFSGAFDRCANGIRPQFASLYSQGDLELDPDAVGSANVAVSVRQDIVGIDPVDPEVELSIFGPVEVANGEVTGEATARLEFAGRSFHTNARGFDVFADNVIGEATEAITITNQDGVALNIFENGNGEVEGTLSLDGTELATVGEDIDGVVIVTFSDDSFVSFQ